MSAVGAEADPILSTEFAELMRPFEPFEPAASLAVACSGGPDSMALLVLAKAWVKAAGGKLTALIVDHQLRDDSTAEANIVAGRVRALGVDALVLAWSGARPAANVQEKARAARYRVLFEWCAANAVLHLLVAHHKGDQAETVLLRNDRGSGDDGLAGMSALQEFGRVRLLRPLLPVTKSRLQATVEASGVDTVADPTNEDLRFDRVRVRQRLVRSNRAAEWCDVGAKASERRQARDVATNRHLAANCEIYPEGYARLHSAFWRGASEEIERRSLSAIIAAIGGRSHPPRRRKVEELYDKLKSDRLKGGATSGGCQIVPESDGALVMREVGLVAEHAAVNGQMKWDGRFDVEFCGDVSGYTVGSLGSAGLRSILKDRPDLAVDHLPRKVLETLPSVWALERVIEVPHLCYASEVSSGKGKFVRNVCFAPIRPIQATRFTM